MKIVAALLAAGLMAGVASVPAKAAPQATQMAITETGGAVEQVQIRTRGINRNRGFNRNRGYNRRNFSGNRGYRRAPRGWNRYSSRPRNYRSRGCIIIGPVWYCP